MPSRWQRVLRLLPTLTSAQTWCAHPLGSLLPAQSLMKRPADLLSVGNLLILAVWLCALCRLGLCCWHGPYLRCARSHHTTQIAWKMRVESDWVAYAGAHQHRRVRPARALPLDGQGLDSGAAAARRAFDSLQVRPSSLCECSLHLKCPPQVGQAIWSRCAYAPYTVNCRRMRTS